MCGVVAARGAAPVAEMTARLAHRGPDAQGVADAGGGVVLGHSRLAILDLDRRSDQPFRRGSLLLSYNGEVWNHAAVRRELEAGGDAFSTTGDTEVVAAALRRWGSAALPRLEGMFGMAWSTGDGALHLARDRFGEVPLHVFAGGVAASELKAVEGRAPAAWVGPGEHVVITEGGLTRERWYRPPTAPVVIDRAQASEQLRALVELGCRERAISDVPVCTLLSGGIDSAAVAWGLSQVVPGLTAFVAVMNKRSPDLRCAREVAEHLGITLVEVTIPPPTPADLARVVRAIELPHKAQVEIGWACLVLADAIRSSGFKVTFSGEGSDELWASYGFAYHGLARAGWHEYRRDLFLGQHRKNFPRCNKVMLSRGVECRLPFLHTALVEFALSLPRAVVEDRPGDKAVMREAFRGVLPRSVTERPKLAFQDGLGLKTVIAETLPSPAAFYRAEFATAFGKEVA